MRKEMAKARPSIASNPALKGAAEVLNDLDTFLSDVGDEEEEKGQQSDDEITLDFGDVCAECRAGTSPMILAVTSGHTSCLKEMLERNLDELDLTTVLSENGATLAHIAARKGDLEALKAIVSAEQSLCEVGDIRGATPLHVCAYHGRLDCLSCLLEGGAEANLGDFDGATPVHFAAASGHLDCLKKLVKRGKGDPNAQTESGETPVYFAAQEGHLDCVHWLVEHSHADTQLASNDGMTPLHAAAQTGRLNVTHWLVRSAKCPINCRTCDGATPVHFAAAKGHVAILEWLLHHSLASGVEQDDYGATPIHDAAEQGQLKCLHVFYSHSVDLNYRDCDGLTPLDFAMEKGHQECVEFLKNPQKAFDTAKKQHRGAKNAELRLLITPNYGKENPTKTKKKRTLGGFLGGKKKAKNTTTKL